MNFRALAISRKTGKRVYASRKHSRQVAGMMLARWLANKHSSCYNVTIKKEA